MSQKLNPAVLLRNLENLIDRERECLQRFEYDKIDEFSKKKEELLDLLDNAAATSTHIFHDAAPRPDLLRVKEKVASNMAMVIAVMEGLKSARGTLERIFKQSHTLNFYNQEGRNISVPTGVAEKTRRV